jgi:transposase-like protein
MPRPYPKEFRRARLSWCAKAMGRSLRSPRSWGSRSRGCAGGVAQEQRDRGERSDGQTSAEREELRALRRENARLKQEKEILRQAARLLRPGGDPVSRFRFIAAEKDHHPISWMCDLLGVSGSGYHAWVAGAPSDRTLCDAWLLEWIRQIHQENRGVYGARGCMPSCGSPHAFAWGANGLSG